MSPERRPFSVAVREERVKCEISRSELAEMTGVSTFTVARWETGSLLPLVDQVKDLCWVLGLDGLTVILPYQLDEWDARRRERMVPFRRPRKKAPAPPKLPPEPRFVPPNPAAFVRQSGLLESRCWCERREVWLSSVQVLLGVTESCGAPECVALVGGYSALRSYELAGSRLPSLPRKMAVLVDLFSMRRWA